MLVLTMLFPSIALAGDIDMALAEDIFGLSQIEIEDSPWLNLPEIEPIRIDSTGFSEFVSSPVSAFDDFLLESVDTVPVYVALPINELTEQPPEMLAELLHTFDSDMMRYSSNDVAEFSALMRQGLNFSHLSENNRALIFRQLNIMQESAWIAEQLLTTMEHDGFTLHDSVELLRIMSTGLFSYSEAQIFFRLVPSPYIRQSELARFEQFAQKFDIADEVNARRLSGSPFFSINGFDEGVDPFARTARGAAAFFTSSDLDMQVQSPSALNQDAPLVPETVWRTRPWRGADVEALRERPDIEPIFTAFTNENAFVVALGLLLNNHSVAEIETAFALGAALQVEPQTFMLQPGIYYAALGLQHFGETSPSALSVLITTDATPGESNVFFELDTSPQMFNHFEVGDFLNTPPPPPPSMPLVIQPQALDSGQTGQILSSAMRHPFDAQGVMNAADVHADELEDIINYGMAIMASGAPMMMATSGGLSHSHIIANPFNLDFNANESVQLNTGAGMFRTNVLSLPGRGGFDLNLDLFYSSANADFYRMTTHNSILQRHNLHGLGVGWIFDLPYILDDALYVPGRGKFQLNGNQILEYSLQDMQLVNDTTFLSGQLRSTRRLNFTNGTSYFFSSEYIIGMVDRFGNTIRFEYMVVSQFINHRLLLSRIVDTNGQEIRFQYTASGSNRTITVTAPDGGVYTINMSAIIGYMSHLTANPGHFQINSVVNQVGAVTSFNNFVGRFFFDSHLKTPSTINYTLLITQVTYPSGAFLRFGYAYHTINKGRNGSRHAYRVTSRTLHNHTARHGWREYLRTTFTYQGEATAFPQLVDRPPANHTYSVTVTQNNGLRTVYTFNHLHLNTAQSMQNGNTLLSIQSIGYNSDRLPTSIELVEHRSGRTRNTRQAFTYNRHGQVLTAVSPLAQGSTNARYVTTYTYDNRFGLMLTRTSMPDANTTIREVNVLSADGRNIVRSYVYENNVRQSRADFTHDAHGNIIGIREFPDARGAYFTSTTITFDRGTLPSAIRTMDTYAREAGSAITGSTGGIERRFTYDSMWRTLTETDPNGYVTRWQYDRVGRVTSTTFPNGGVETYTYDDRLNRMTHRTVLGATYTHQFDGLGNLLNISVGGTIIRRNYYDNRMRLVDTFNAAGINSSQHTQFRYDVFDRVIRHANLRPDGVYATIETVTFDDISDTAGNARVTTRIHGSTTVGVPHIDSFVQYDRFGRRTQEGTVGGRVFTYTHDLAGRVVTEQSLGIHNTFTHNIFGVTSVRNIEGNTSRNEYDSMGRLIRSSDFMGNFTRFTYDVLGRLIRQDVPFERVGTTTHYATTRYAYDRNGNLTQTSTLVSRPGQPQVWSNTDNTFRHNMLISSQTGGADGVRTEYTYDLAGNILTQRVGAATTTFAYDNRGQLIRTTDALGQSETFTYDANGLLLTRTDRNGTLFRKTYDHVGRLRNEEAVQNGVVTSFRQYQFRPTGLLQWERNNTHTITYYYDAQGRVIRKTETGGVVMTYSYNAANNLLQTRGYINGTLHTFSVYTYDNAQRLHTVTGSTNPNAPLSTYTYNANGNRTRKTLANGVTTEYTLNLAGMVTSLTNSRGGSVLSSFQYSYFLDGNIYRIVEPDRTTVYTYDMARRLVREESQMQIATHLPAGYAPPIPLTIPYPSSAVSLVREYFFDNRNNRTRMTTRGSHSNYDVVYSFDLNNRLLTSTTTYTGVNPRTTTTTLTYDRNGNQLTNATTGQPIETRRYNAFNQLIEVTRPRGFPSPPAITASYTYRGDGLRHSKTVNGATITHVWDRGNIVLERNQTGGVVNRYDRTSRGQLIHSHVHGFYHFNARGDVVQRTDATGHVLMTYQYDAFGNELNPSLANNNPFRFAGEYWDWGTETYYLRARSFNPRTGRFTQPDPFWNVRNMQGSTAAILQSGNLYVYTMNNPIMWSDPSGESALLVIGGAIIGGIIAGGIVSGGGSSSGSSSDSSGGGGGSWGGNNLDAGSVGNTRPGGSVSFSVSPAVVVHIPVPGGTRGSSTVTTPWWLRPWGNNSPTPTPVHQGPTPVITGFPSHQEMWRNTVNLLDAVGFATAQTARNILRSDTGTTTGTGNGSAPNAGTTDERSLPPTGDPGTVRRRVNNRGEVVQEREYGSDRRPIRDVDWGHPHHHGLAPGQPHEHIWDWSDPDDPRRPGRPIGHH